jgi:hypothetical protein
MVAHRLMLDEGTEADALNSTVDLDPNRPFHG